MRTLIIFILLIIASVLNTGCALHAPLSETSIFNEDLEEAEDIRSIVDFSESRMGITTSFYTNNFQSKYLMDNPEITDSVMSVFWKFSLIGLSFVIKPTERLTFGVNPSLLFNAGFDFNYHFGKGFHLTGVGNVQKNAELIFQKKLFHGKIFQGSLGICYRYEKQQFQSIFNMGVGKKFSVDLYGLRYLMNIKFNERQLSMLAGFYIEQKYKTPVFNIGFLYKLPLSKKTKRNPWE